MPKRKLSAWEKVSQECELAMTSDLTDVLATVAQLMENNDNVSSLPKSCGTAGP